MSPSPSRIALRSSTIEAADILLTAKTQRWAPEVTLRVLVELEITARDESNCRNRMTAARFPVDKTLDSFNLAESSIPTASHDYLVTLDWITTSSPPPATATGSATAPPDDRRRNREDFSWPPARTADGHTRGRQVGR
jgi:hypothetical protein